MIELLVSIAMMAVLAGMLLPVLSRSKESARAVSCQNNIRQLDMACLTYTDDFQDKLPYNMGAAEIIRAVDRDRYYNWTSPVMSWELDSDNTNTVLLTWGGIGPYVGKNAGVYRCPTDRVLSDLQKQAGWRERVRSISMNAMVGDAGEYSRTGENVNNPDYIQFFKLTQIPRPAHIFMLIEEHPDSINDGYFLNKYHSGKWTDLPASYHHGAANLSFADGHAEKHSWLYPLTKPAPKPDAARLPFRVPARESGDFEWLMDRTSIDND